MMEIIHFACSNAIYNMNTSYYIFLVITELHKNVHRHGYLLFPSVPVNIVNTLKQNQATENSIAWPVISLLPGHVICHVTAM